MAIAKNFKKNLGNRLDLFKNLRNHLLRKKQRFRKRLCDSYFHGTLKKLLTDFVVNLKKNQ